MNYEKESNHHFIFGFSDITIDSSIDRVPERKLINTDHTSHRLCDYRCENTIGEKKLSSKIPRLSGYQSCAVSVLSWSHSRLPLEKAAEESGALEIQSVGNLEDGLVCVTE